MKIPVVNSKDEIIRYKEREELDLDKDIVRSASLWITNSRGQVLLAQRKFTKRTDPGKWAEAVGGTVDGEDSYEETVYREADEELGIRGVAFTLGPKQFVQGPPNSYFVQWYYAVLDWPIEKFVPQESEVEHIAWWGLGELRDDMSAYPDRYIGALPGMVTLLHTD
jgi:isopentenyldiphosphate isomerase